MSVASLYLLVSKERSNSNLDGQKQVVGQWTYLTDVPDLKCLMFLIWQMREFHKLLMKESYNTEQFNIYWILGNFLEKIILRKLYALYFKWLLWDFNLRPLEYGQFIVKSWKLQQRYVWPGVNWYPHQHSWIICIWICISETGSKSDQQKRKVASNFIFKLQGALLVKVSFITY